ncbi:MAG TPA: hypothetical protein VFN68_11520 [Acidimicrobiales bacterium]|nr:hypothetical protein [Acidimicrobiales bacterium]
MRTLAEIVPLRTAACREAVDAVAQMAAGEPDVDPHSRAHVGSCLRCQAELAAFRRVLRLMRSMRTDAVPVPAGSLAELLQALGESADGEGLASPTGSRAVRAACLGGITAAGAAGVLVWFSRRRLGLPHAS